LSAAVSSGRRSAIPSSRWVAPAARNLFLLWTPVRIPATIPAPDRVPHRTPLAVLPAKAA
jgi:hypothetical protein